MVQILVGKSTGLRNQCNKLVKIHIENGVKSHVLRQWEDIVCLGSDRL